MIEAILGIVVSLIATAIIVGLSLLVLKVCDSCNHCYERIDTCNDKKMVLVCSRCGKIKKLRK